MTNQSQVALLLAVSEREELFNMFDEVFSSDNYHKVLMTFEEGMQYVDIAEELEIGEGTVSRAFEELEEFGLIVDDGEGRAHAIPILKHPMIQYHYWKDVVGDE